MTLALQAGAKDFVVVIDAGHGGKDGGALGLTTNEKTINLTVAKKLKALLDKEDDVRVEMTRSTDRFVTLQGRANFANSKHADIFVSIHANALDRKSAANKRVHGAAVYTLGLDRSETNLKVAMRENEVMKLEDDYTTTYQGFDPSSTESYIAFEMMQHKNMDQSIALADAVQNQLVRTAGRKNNGVRQAPFWVLVRTSMPAILVELDFISNATQERYMASEEGSSQLAQAIANGIKRYRSGSKSKTSSTPKTSPARHRPIDNDAVEEEPQQSATTAAKGEIVYKIQFLTAPKPLPKNHLGLKGLKDVDYYRDGGVVKYTTGAYSTLDEANRALKDVKKKYSDAFVIKTRDGKRIK